MRKEALRLALLNVAGRMLRARIARRPSVGPRRVLVVRPDHLGDLLFAVPALRLLREWLPDAHITALVGPWSADVVRRCAYVDDVQTCIFPWFDRQPKAALWEPYRLALTQADRLRAGKYDAAVILRFDHWWGALVAALAGIPERTGYSLPECRPFLTQSVPYVPGRHEVRQNVRLVAAACGRPDPLGEGPQTEEFPLEYRVTDAEEAGAAERLSAAGEGPLVALHVGAGAAVKLWPVEHFVRLGAALQERHGVTIVLTGSGAEAGLVRQVAAGLRRAPVELVDAPLGEVAAVLRRCRAVVGADSGILHLAVAMGAPTVHLYGPVSRHTFGPWGKTERHRVVFTNLACAPCNRLDYSPEELPAHPCIRDISVERVLDASEAVLGRKAPCA